MITIEIEMERNHPEGKNGFHVTTSGNSGDILERAIATALHLEIGRFLKSFDNKPSVPVVDETGKVTEQQPVQQKQGE